MLVVEWFIHLWVELMSHVSFNFVRESFSFMRSLRKTWLMWSLTTWTCFCNMFSVRSRSKTFFFRILALLVRHSGICLLTIFQHESCCRIYYVYRDWSASNELIFLVFINFKFNLRLVHFPSYQGIFIVIVFNNFLDIF